MLPNLSKLVDANADVGVPVLPNPDNVPTLKRDKQLQNVPGDGSCLYHCLVKLRSLSDPWLGEATPSAPTVELLKDSMEQYFLANYKTQFSPHWHEYLLEYFKVPFQEFSVFDSTRLARRYTSEFMMKQGAYGGDLEIDIAARLFGVIIHKFERNTYNVNKNTPMLTTSFYPTDELNDKNRTTPKWILVLLPGHYNYVIPEPPRNAVVRQTPSTPSETPPLEDARMRAEMMKRLRDRKTGGQKEFSDMEQKNAALRKLAQEREARQKPQSQPQPPPSCAWRPILKLTDREQRQLDQFEQLRLLELEENDAAFARRLQQEEEERAKQIDDDRRMAESLS